MMNSKYSYILKVCLILGISGCTPGAQHSQKPQNFDVLLPAAEWGQVATLKPVTLKGLTQLDALEGVYGKFVFAPKVDGEFKGSPVQTMFVKTDHDVWIPANSLSRDVGTVYSHLQALHDFDKELGVDTLNQWPLKIGISVRMKDSEGDYILSNSFYDGRADAILIVPYDDGRLPIAQNGGIIAHEHFHSFFFKKVVSPLIQQGRVSKSIIAHVHEDPEFVFDHFFEKENSSAEQVYDYLLIKALNEGLADYWGWVYSGQDEFVAESLPDEKGKRSLKEEKVGDAVPVLLTQTKLIGKIQTMMQQKPQALQRFVNQMAYQLGTSYSRILVTMTLVTAESRGIAVKAAAKMNAKKIMNLLENIKTEFVEKSEAGTVETSLLVDQMKKLDLNEKENACLQPYISGEKQ